MTFFSACLAYLGIAVIFSALLLCGFKLYLIIMTIVAFIWFPLCHIMFNRSGGKYVKFSWKQFLDIYNLSPKKFKIDDGQFYYRIDQYNYFCDMSNYIQIKLNFFSWIKLSFFMSIQKYFEKKETNKKNNEDGLQEMIKSINKDINALNKQIEKDNVTIFWN